MSNEPIKIQNNFSKFKADFKSDTGLDADKEIGLYIQYFNARMNDMSYQVIHGVSHLLLNKIDFLPSSIRTQISEMISQHPIIKDIVKGKS